MIRVRNLIKDYCDDDVITPVLKGISLDIAAGSFVAITGPSGSGKSTLLHILSMLELPTDGEYFFQDQAVEALSETQRAHIRNGKIGFVFQAFNLMLRSTVYENVELPLIYSILPTQKRKARIERAVESVGLTDKLTVEAAKLSGGQKQRIAIARALVNEPDVIFADEPTGNLDSQSGGQVMGIFSELNKAGHTIILVTHETYTAEFANRIIAIRDGMIASDDVVMNQRQAKDFIK